MTEPEMDLPQRLAVQKVLSERLAALRTETLVPEAREVMTVGERRPARFGGVLAAWIGLPKASKRVTVTDREALLAWARKHMPSRVEKVTSVKVTDELIDYLAENAPQFLGEHEMLDPHVEDDLCKALKERGQVGDANGEKHTRVPGITVSDGESTPTVTLQPDAAVIIGEAWRNGTVTIPSLLALPSPEGETDAT